MFAFELPSGEMFLNMYFLLIVFEIKITKFQRR